MKANENKFPLTAILTIILFATLTRISMPSFMGFSANFSPIDAIALFSGAYLTKRWSAFLVTLLSVWIGDVIINRIYFDHWVVFYQGFYWQYSCYLLITLLGITLNNKFSTLKLITLTLSSSVLFFIISNFGVWFSGVMYPTTLNGLITCYIAAIPFLKNTLLSDLFFSVLFFGSLEWIYRKYSPQMRQTRHMIV